MRIFLSAVARSIDRVRRRWLRAHASPLSKTTGPIIMEAGTVLQAASEDEMMPAAQQGALFLSPPLDSVGSAFETRRVAGRHVPTSSEHTPKPPGGDSDAPSPQRARTAPPEC